MSATVVTIFVAAWILIGLGTGLWMLRRGHDAKWTLIAVMLGPLFVPIAFERVERSPRLATSEPGGPPPPRAAAPSGPRVFVGLDGSPESERALDVALNLLGPRCGMLVLAEVVGHDATEGDSHEAIDAALQRLAAAASRAARSCPADTSVRYEVLAGPPGETLRQFAEEQEMDLLVIGRRGRGLSTRLLGSVSNDLVQHASVPVLVAEPGQAERPAAVEARVGAHRPVG
jgi:nucleotide-binding universal stress UspA family protein